MGCVQQAVLEFDEEVRAPWRPRLVSHAGTGLSPVRHPSRRAPSRVGVSAVPDRRSGPAEKAGEGAARARGAVRPSARPTAPVGEHGGVPARARRARLRLTRRARRLGFVLAVACGVALGLWLAPVLGGEGDLRLAGEGGVVVQQGDTLWSIATTVAGDGDVRAVVDEIRQLNGLRGSDLAPGQVLQLP